MCVSLTSDSLETIKVIIITVTASDVIMHHVLIILTLTFTFMSLRYYTECSVISQSFQAMLITFVVKIV